MERDSVERGRYTVGTLYAQVLKMRLLLHAIVLSLIVQMLTASAIAQETSKGTKGTKGIEHYEDKRVLIFGVRAGYGILGLSYSLSPVLLQWQNIYWNTVKGSGAIGFYNGSYLASLESLVGFRLKVDPINEFRLGLGVGYGEMVNDTYGQHCENVADDALWGSSGSSHQECYAGASQGLISTVEAYYLRRVARHFSFQAGLEIHVSLANMGEAEQGENGYPFPSADLFAGFVF